MLSSMKHTALSNSSHTLPPQMSSTTRSHSHLAKCKLICRTLFFLPLGKRWKSISLILGWQMSFSAEKVLLWAFLFLVMKVFIMVVVGYHPPLLIWILFSVLWHWSKQQMTSSVLCHWVKYTVVLIIVYDHLYTPLSFNHSPLHSWICGSQNVCLSICCTINPQISMVQGHKGLPFCHIAICSKS